MTVFYLNQSQLQDRQAMVPLSPLGRNKAKSAALDCEGYKDQHVRM